MDIEPVGGRWVPPRPNYKKVRRLTFEAANAMNKRLWELAEKRGYKPDGMQVITNDLLNFIEDAANVFGMSEAFVANVMGLVWNTFRERRSQLRRDKAVQAKAAFLAVMNADPHLFDVASKLTSSRLGKLSVAEMQLERLTQVREDSVSLDNVAKTGDDIKDNITTDER